MSEINRSFTPVEIRRLLGITADELAKVLGISVMTLYRKEKNGNWSAKDIRILSEMSNIPIDKITF